MGRDLYSGLWPTFITEDFPLVSLETWAQRWRVANGFLQEPNQQPSLLFRCLVLSFSRCSQFRFLEDYLFSVFLSCAHSFSSISFPSACCGPPPNTFLQCFPFFSSSPNLPCLIGWDDQNLNNHCWHFWVPSLGVRFNPLGETEPWELTACRALSLVVCMFSTIGLTFCSVFEYFVILWLI